MNSALRKPIFFFLFHLSIPFAVSVGIAGAMFISCYKVLEKQSPVKNTSTGEQVG